MRRRMGRPRGSGHRMEQLQRALDAAECSDVGLSIAALIADLHPVPVAYSRVAARLYEATGVAIDRRTLYDWLTEAGRRLGEAINRREGNG